VGTPHVLPDGPLIVGLDEDELTRDAIALGQQLGRAIPGVLMAVYVHTLEGLGALMAGSKLEEFNQAEAAGRGAAG
jgi:hypothetical protein